MTWKLTNFQVPPPFPATSKIFPPPWPWTLKFKRTPHPLLQMIASRLKGNIILGWLICYQVFPSGQVVFRFYYHLINLFEANVVPRAILQIKTFLPSSYRKRRVGFKVSWSLTIYFFVALHSCVCSCPKISRNGFLKKKFPLVLILQSTCFVCITWKRKQTMEQQHTVHANEKTKLTSRRIQIVHAFCLI